MMTPIMSIPRTALRASRVALGAAPQHFDKTDALLLFRAVRHNSGHSVSYLRDLTVPQKHCLQKLINICMLDGKKSKSHLIISKTLSRLSHHGDVITIVINAIENVKPMLEVKKVRISGSTQMVPSLLSRGRQETLAIRWLLEAASKRRSAKKSMSFDQCLCAEILDASHKIGVVRKRRDELHKLAEANRGFSHYRWW
jgi:small subunit ribosomal protein S7